MMKESQRQNRMRRSSFVPDKDAKQNDTGADQRAQREQLSTNQEDRQDRMFYFVQDTWRATNKLTLSYGLRWDTWFPDYSLNAGQGGRYDVTDNLVRIPGVGGEVRRERSAGRDDGRAGERVHPREHSQPECERHTEESDAHQRAVAIPGHGLGGRGAAVYPDDNVFVDSHA